MNLFGLEISLANRGRNTNGYVRITDCHKSQDTVKNDIKDYVREKVDDLKSHINVRIDDVKDFIAKNGR